MGETGSDFSHLHFGYFLVLWDLVLSFSAVCLLQGALGRVRLGYSGIRLCSGIYSGIYSGYSAPGSRRVSNLSFFAKISRLTIFC